MLVGPNSPLAHPEIVSPSPNPLPRGEREQGLIVIVEGPAPSPQPAPTGGAGANWLPIRAARVNLFCDKSENASRKCKLKVRNR